MKNVLRIHTARWCNQWLHPDIVAMQPVDKEWHDLVRNCAKLGSGQTVRLWSFEVKKELTIVVENHFPIMFSIQVGNEVLSCCNIN